MHDQSMAPDAPPLPECATGWRERVATLHDEISSIRLQIATTDIRRQADKKGLDPAWFHRAKTALRVKQQELAQATIHLAGLGGRPHSAPRDAFKDALIDVVREQCDDAQWASLVTQARALHLTRELPHG